MKEQNAKKIENAKVEEQKKTLTERETRALIASNIKNALDEIVKKDKTLCYDLTSKNARLYAHYVCVKRENRAIFKLYAHSIFADVCISATRLQTLTDAEKAIASVHVNNCCEEQICTIQRETREEIERDTIAFCKLLIERDAQTRKAKADAKAKQTQKAKKDAQSDKNAK